jgi:hypothetical protein
MVPRLLQLLEMFLTTWHSTARPRAFPHPSLFATTALPDSGPTALETVAHRFPRGKIVPALQLPHEHMWNVTATTVQIFLLNKLLFF